MEEEKTITCNEPVGSATVKGASPTAILAVTPGFQGSCQFFGQEVTVKNNGCNFEFTADGLLHIKSEEGKECKQGKQPISFETKAPFECKVEVGEQTVKGIVYHNLAEGTITVNVPETGLPNLSFNATGKDCPFGALSTGNFTTGNAIITGEKKGTETMVNVSLGKSGEPLFHSELAATTITSTADGEGEAAHHVLDVAGSSLECGAASFHGVQSNREVSELTLTPEYSSCIFLGKATSVSMNGCDLVFHASGKVDIASRSGKIAKPNRSNSRCRVANLKSDPDWPAGSDVSGHRTCRI